MEINENILDDIKGFGKALTDILYKIIDKGDLEKQLKEILETAQNMQAFIKEREKTMHLDELTEDERKFLEQIDVNWRNAKLETTEPTK